MNIKLESMGGEAIDKCFNEALYIANLLKITAEFEFNGICCMVKPNGNKQKFLSEYDLSINSTSQYKFATA